MNRHLTKPRLRRGLLITLWLIVALWIAGLFQFVDHIKALTEPVIDAEMAPTDAIVALTGGSERLPAAIDLLLQHKGQKLFVSGVHPGLSLDRLLARQLIPAELRSCCIVLGHAAESTRGNAVETRLWLAAEDFHSLRLVTGNYHMPRSLLLFHAAMPEAVIVPHPVAPDSVRLDAWWVRPGTASLLATEYNKYLWAWLRQELLTKGRA